MLWSLAQGASEQPLLLVLAIDPTQKPEAQQLIRNLSQRAHRVALRPLAAGEVRALVEASFGPVPGSERMAEWLHRVSGGNPLGCVELLRHLLEARAIRFAEGVWVLPAELSSAELPTALEQVIEARIDRLPGAARKLANALSVARGVTPSERCVAIAKLEGIDDPAAAIAALVDAQIVIEDDDGCRFTHETLRRELGSRIDGVERKRLHRVLGSLLSDHRAAYPRCCSTWLAIAARRRRAARRTLLADAGVSIAGNANAMPAAIPALRAALDAFRTQKRGAHELALRARALGMAGYYTTRRIMEQYGEEALRSWPT